MSEYRHCQEKVYVRDTWRYSGRGKGGFSLHYTERSCQRFVKDGDTHCWQHRQAEATGPAGGGDGADAG